MVFLSRKLSWLFLSKLYLMNKDKWTGSNFYRLSESVWIKKGEALLRMSMNFWPISMKHYLRKTYVQNYLFSGSFWSLRNWPGKGWKDVCSKCTLKIDLFVTNFRWTTRKRRVCRIFWWSECEFPSWRAFHQVRWALLGIYCREVPGSQWIIIEIHHQITQVQTNPKK